tara:strand:- start:199 stop:1431 length:1233 start_codon:yes stop_codon:yes gene_type:complete
MWGAYTFQIINLAVAVLIVPLLLRGLGPGEYTLWLLFSSIMGAMTQVQNGIQGVAVKQIAIAFHRGSRTDLLREIGISRTNYRRFTIIVAGPVLAGSLVYFFYTQNLTRDEYIAWIILVLGYCISYWYAPNNAILLATDRVGLNANINTLTRVVYFFGSVVIIYIWPSLIAPCTALAVASIVGTALNTLYAKRRISSVTMHKNTDVAPTIRGSVRRYTSYTLSAFMLYTGSLIIVAPLFPSQTASYGLALQMSALTATIALVPIQVWLARLVRADHTVARRELKMTLAVCNILYLSGYTALILIVPTLLELIGSSVRLPLTLVMILMGSAFLLELNISVLVNHLTANADYSFTSRYAIVAAVGLAFGTFVAITTGILWLGFLVVPMTLQALHTLPYMVRKITTLKGIAYE